MTDPGLSFSAEPSAHYLGGAPGVLRVITQGIRVKNLEQ